MEAMKAGSNRTAPIHSIESWKGKEIITCIGHCCDLHEKVILERGA